MNCPKCGAINADDATFCSLCNERFISATLKQNEVDEGLDNNHAVGGYPAEENKNVDVGGQTSDDKGPELLSEIPNEHIDEDENVKGFNPTTHEPSIPVNFDESEVHVQTAVKSSIFAFTKWVYPAVLATAISILVVKLVQKIPIAAELPLSKIVLISVLLGFVVSSGGLVQKDLKLSFTGWLLGLSGSFLAFNIMFFGGYIISKISTKLFTLLIGQEILLISGFLAVAVTFFFMLDNVPPVYVFISGMLVLIIFTFISWALKRWINPLPFVAFLAWPVNFYIFEWVALRQIKHESL